ncbi:type VI secretion system contractile sheath small subunit [Rugamonas sp. CCM 8940]|uniref:type VI secretion system contractile sheath small subunit n=1 Tax=Rugamonas sp. CCM 8940 TaxID=2765359 RepID=UPI0018F2ED74|nr:type VI secretion system contractile sheath small subunit [Rugamonas sp. CCM 8940]MBJ7313458.1 type VI secretion system contractile sheath small subunit [Rugamonas sp. CCM 8940]
MSSESSQKWLERNRPPRVQICYEVETGGALKKRELPLVVGILANLEGREDSDVRKLTDQRFIEIDRDNFDGVMEKIGPKLVFGEFKTRPGIATGQIAFTKLDHFEPGHLVEHVDGLKELYGQRQRLRDLMAKIDGNRDLHDALTLELDKTSGQFGGWVELAAAKPGDKGAAVDPAGLTPEALAGLAPEALKAASDEQLKALSAEQKAALTEAQKAALSDEQRALLG